MNAGRNGVVAALAAAATISAQFMAPVPLGGQEPERVPVVVDVDGVMRWSDTGREVALFGVNYATPFAHGYRAHAYVGADRRRAIDVDVDHLARLGLDAFRIHVWDRQISDRQGNLVENDHLDLLDYLIHRLSERGIKTVLTPIAWWPPGYPEPNPETSGLSDLFGKGGMTTEPSARAPQANYLTQFIQHVNPYKGVSYRDDPDVLAVEVFNEPAHPGGPEATTAYINDMVAALREAGLEKPIFYNISQGNSETHGRAICSADIQGVTYQWYPTGLVRNSSIGGNMLPNVDRYTSPYTALPECADKALLVYEFDSADVGASYMYPAMARSFREAGVQWATQFAYDPVFIAHANTEYQTHFLNLVYSPSKAISFMIAGEAFRRTPRGAGYGTYPETTGFEGIRVSYEEDLSELVTDTAYFHSNATDTRPPAPGALRRVAGVGSSPLVEYDGTGSYFLDRLASGVWRLEVYPDVVWVRDPFARPSLSRVASRVIWRTRSMEIRLPDLGEGFRVRPLNEGNTQRPRVEGTSFAIRPGSYLVTRRGADASGWDGDRVAGNRPLGAFFAPPTTGGPVTVLHTPVAEAPAGEPLSVAVEVVSDAPVDSVVLRGPHAGPGFGRPTRFAMDRRGAFRYEATLPAAAMTPGLAEYSVVVWAGGEARTYPGAHEGSPGDWDFVGTRGWEVTVVPPAAPVVLFDARRDRGHMLMPNRWGYVPFQSRFIPGGTPGSLALRGVVQSLEPDPHHFALRTFLAPEDKNRLGDATGAVIRLRARSAGGSEDRMEVALVLEDGTAWGAAVDLTGEWQDLRIPLADLVRVPLVLLPRPYPQFLPYRLDGAAGDSEPGLSRLDGLQFAVGREHFDGPADGAHGFEVERVVLVFDPGS